jgi:hypothetical protein
MRVVCGRPPSSADRVAAFAAGPASGQVSSEAVLVGGTVARTIVADDLRAVAVNLPGIRRGRRVMLRPSAGRPRFRPGQ